MNMASHWSTVSFIVCLSLLAIEKSNAWGNPNIAKKNSIHTSRSRKSSLVTLNVKKHGENSCFLPLKQLDQDYYAPRIIHIAGSFPDVTREEFDSVTSEPSPDQGQWVYEISDPETSQGATIAIEGSSTIHYMKDPVVLIGDHFTLGVPLPEVLEEPVDLVMAVDRARNFFSERKFLIMSVPGVDELECGAFNSKAEMPEGAEVLGQVMLVQIPWLPCMQKTRSGFMEEDEYF